MFGSIHVAVFLDLLVLFLPHTFSGLCLQTRKAIVVLLLRKQSHNFDFPNRVNIWYIVYERFEDVVRFA